jgi:PAS domain S-box-containing protein
MPMKKIPASRAAKQGPPISMAPENIPNQTDSPKVRFQGRLFRTILLTLWAISLLPIILILVVIVAYIPQQVFDGGTAPLGIILLLISILLIGTLSWLVARNLSQPILKLVASTQLFAQGNWLQRVDLKRNDEIGELAATFNHMADKLSNLNQSLESQVEERTQQLKAASAVGQITTTSTDLGDLFLRTCNLVAERFDCYNACIYTIDETNIYAVLRQYSGNVGEALRRKNYRLPVNSQSLIGWVAANNQTRFVPEAFDYPFIIRDNLLPQVRSEVGVPISLGNRVLGVLSLQSASPQAYDLDRINVLLTIGSQLATAIQNIQLIQSTKDTLQGTSILYQTSHHIVMAQNEQEIIQAITNALKRSLYFTGLLISKDGSFVFNFINDPGGKEIPESLFTSKIPSGVIQNYISTPAPLIFSEISRAPSELSSIISPYRSFGGQSIALIPLMSNGHLAGILVIAARERGVLNASVVEPYTNLMDITGAALDRLKTLQDLQRRQIELQTTSEVGLTISLETNLNRLYQVVHNQVRRLLGDVFFLIAIYHPKSNQIEIPYVYEGSDLISLEPFPLGEGLTSILIKNRKPLLLVQDTEKRAAELGAKIVGKPAKSWLGVPLIAGDEVVGAMIVQDVDHELRFTENDVSLLSTLAPQIAVVIRNDQLLGEMQVLVANVKNEEYLVNVLLETIPDRVFFKDKEGRYMRANRSLLSRLNIKDFSQLMGKSDFNFYSDEYAAQVFKDEQEIIKSGREIVEKIEKETLPNHDDQWILTSKAPLRNQSNEIIGLLGISRDITELMNIQETAERRARQLQTTAEIARDIAGTLQLDNLLLGAVNLVKERFGFYHASIFLIDSANEYAVLKEATGEAGRQMKLSRHKLEIGSKSIVGQVTARGEPLVVNDVNKDPTFLPNPLLPHTHAELTIPLRLATRVLGALDVQSTQFNAFSPEDVGILQILADQLAIAVVNSELFSRTQQNLVQHRLLHQVTTAASSSMNVQDALDSVVNGLRVIFDDVRVSILLISHEKDTSRGTLEVKAWAGYADEQKMSNLKIHLGEGVTGIAAADGQVVSINDTRLDSRYISIDSTVLSEIAIPLIYHEETVGVLNIESTRVNAFNENERELLGTLGGSLAAIFANASLVEQIQKQIERQKLLYDVTNKIRRAVDMDSILQTSAKEICQALGARRTHIEVTLGQNIPVAGQTLELGNGKESKR